MKDRSGTAAGGFWGDSDSERALQQYRTVVDAFGDGIYQLDCEGRFVAVNDPLLDRMGYARDDLIGKHVSFLFGDRDADRVDTVVRTLAETPRSSRVKTIECHVRTADGTKLRCEHRFSSVPGITGDDDPGVAGNVRFLESTPSTKESTPSPPGDTLGSLLDYADGIGVFVLDEDLEVIWIDETIEQYFGLNREDVIGRDKRRLIEEEIQSAVSSPDEFTETIRATYDEDPAFEQVECHVIAGEDREERWLERLGKPIDSGPYAGGRIELYYDITDRKRSQEALRESEAEFESLVDAVEEYAIFRLDPDGNVVSWNEGAEKIKGYEAEDILGEHFSTFYTDQDRAANVPDRNLERATEHGSIEDEGWRVQKDGSRFWANVTITAIRDDDGSHRGYLKVTRDTTDRYRREQELERIFGRISDGFIALDDRNRFTHVNERAQQFLGVDREELLGTNIWEAFPEMRNTVFERRYREALDTQEPISFEAYFPLDDSWFEEHVYPSETGLSIYFRDVTDRIESERELERALDLLNKTERIADVAGWEVDPETKEPFWSDHLFDLLDVDYDEQPSLEEALDVYYTEDDRAIVEGAIEEALETGDPFDVEVQFPRPAGDVGWLRIQGDPEVEDGEVVSLRGALQDITEHKEREQFLENAKAQLEAATEAGAVGTWEWHISEDQMVVGSSFARTFDIDPSAAREGVSLGRFLESIHEDDRDRVEAEIAEAVETCGEYEQEYRVRNADDEVRWVVARGHVTCDEDGNAVTFPGALTDITERKQAEIAVERRSKEFESLFHVLPVGAVVADADGSLLRANDVAKEIWGGDVFDAQSVEEYDKFSAVRADTDDPVEPEDWTMSQVLRGETVTEPNVYEIDTFDDERRIIMEHGTPVRDEDGDVRRAVVTLTDITERKEYERKLEESNERLEQFAYAASHDLQEPLRMISSYLQLLERRYGDALDDDGEEFLEYAVDGAERMREMIDALLEYSRVETRGDPFEPVELNALLDEVREDLRVKIEESDAEITAEDLPRVEGDPSQLRQVFQNVLDNAIEYSGDEPPRVHVSADRDGDEWIVSVSDRGIGIDPDEADRVFDVFDRLHTRDEHEGTGIGLALCERIIERHGGDIWVDSELGEGATFSFTVPAVDDPDREQN